MSQIILNAEMAKQLAEASSPVMVVNEQGTMIGYCTPVHARNAPPYTPEELASRRKELARRRQEAREHPERCKSTAEVLAYLHGLPKS